MSYHADLSGSGAMALDLPLCPQCGAGVDRTISMREHQAFACAVKFARPPVAIHVPAAPLPETTTVTEIINEVLDAPRSVRARRRAYIRVAANPVPEGVRRSIDRLRRAVRAAPDAVAKVTLKLAAKNLVIERAPLFTSRIAVTGLLEEIASWEVGE